MNCSTNKLSALSEYESSSQKSSSTEVAGYFSSTLSSKPSNSSDSNAKEFTLRPSKSSMVFSDSEDSNLSTSFYSRGATKMGPLKLTLFGGTNNKMDWSQHEKDFKSLHQENVKKLVKEKSEQNFLQKGNKKLNVLSFSSSPSTGSTSDKEEESINNKIDNDDDKNNITLRLLESEKNNCFVTPTSLLEQSDNDSVESDWDINVKKSISRKRIFSESETEDNIENDKSHIADNGNLFFCNLNCSMKYLN